MKTFSPSVLNRAVVLIAEAIEKKKAMAGRDLGKHPEDGKPITVATGRFGPFVKHGKLYATLPKGTASEDVTLEQAVQLLAARAAKGGKGGKAKGAKALQPDAANDDAVKAPQKPAKKAAKKKAGAKKA